MSSLPAVILTGNVKAALSKTSLSNPLTSLSPSVSLSAVANARTVCSRTKLPNPLTSLPPIRSPIKALYTTEPMPVVSWLRTHAPPCSQLGIDTETRPSFVKNEVNKCALLQIATSTGNALVLPLLQLSQESWAEIRPHLERVIGDRSILKLGAGVHYDMINLVRDWNLNVNLKDKAGYGSLDIADLARLAEAEPNGEGFGLRALGKRYLNVHVSKRYQTSNWEKDPLTVPMVEYATRDAWLGIAIFERLHSRLGPLIVQQEIYRQVAQQLVSKSAKRRKAAAKRKRKKAAAARIIETIDLDHGKS